MNDHWLETYRSLIKLSTEGFKFSALINGGAAVALLAYLGQLAGRGMPLPDLRLPMGAFLIGLAFCGFSILAAYLTQLTLLHEVANDGAPGAVPHHRLLLTAIALFLASLLAFIIGGWLAVSALR
jgi:hypothetical protein